MTRLRVMRDKGEGVDPLFARTPPQSVESERAVLGAILLDPAAISELKAILLPEHFHRVAHATVYAAMLGLHRASVGIDAVTLAGALRDHGTLDAIGGPQEIAEFMGAVPTAANARYYARLIVDTARLRSAIAAEARSLGDLYDNAVPVADRLSALDRRLEKAAQERRMQAEAGKVIAITPGLVETLDDAEAALAEADVFVRGGRLVRTRIGRDRAGDPEGISFEPLPQASLLEALSRAARWEGEDKKGAVRISAPPDKIVKMLYEKGTFGNIREVVGVVDRPTLRSDGTIAQEDGWDRGCRMLVQRSCAFPPVPDTPTKDEAHLALDRIKYLVTDYEFVDDCDRTAWLSLVLTLIGRNAIKGPCPAFVVRAPERGAGKSLLADIPSILATGLSAPRKGWPAFEEEQEKVLGAIGMSGTPLALFDNLTAPWGGEGLVKAIDAPGSIENRELGHSREFSWFAPVFVATGTNLDIKSDMGRRVIPIGFDPGIENPDQRQATTFAVMKDHGMNLQPYTKAQRGPLVSAVLTVWRWWFSAGKPATDDNGIHISTRSALGSFDEWTATVRALLWALGEGDACDGQARFRALSDANLDAHRVLLEAWLKILPGEWLTTRGLKARVMSLAGEDRAELSEAVAALHPKLDASALEVKHMEKALRQLEGRVLSGLALTSKQEATEKVKGERMWSVTRKES